MDETVQTTTNTNPVGFPGAAPVEPKPQKNWKWLIVLILFLIVIGGVVYFVFKSSKSASSLSDQNSTPEATISADQNPTPVESPSASPVAKDQIKIQVLNGTGIPGEAGLLSDALKGLGYTSVTTGNAPTQNATTTQVTFGASVSQDVVTEITTKLKDMYQDVTTNNGSLSNSDIQITTGLRKGQTQAPSATSTPAASATPSPTPTPTASG